MRWCISHPNCLGRKGCTLSIHQSRITKSEALQQPTLTLLYWHIGDRIHDEILRGERAEYGKSIISSLSHQLILEYGNGFNKTNLHRMVKFSETFPDKQIVASLTQQLSWTHFVTLIPIQDSLKRDFYAEMCRIEKWNVRPLRKKIDSMLMKEQLFQRSQNSSLRQNWTCCVKKTSSHQILFSETPTCCNFEFE
jgi:hypothetical protein